MVVVVVVVVVVLACWLRPLAFRRLARTGFPQAQKPIFLIEKCFSDEKDNRNYILLFKSCISLMKSSSNLEYMKH